MYVVGIDFSGESLKIARERNPGIPFHQKERQDMKTNEIICERYRLGNIRSVTPVRPGTMARVWKLETDKGAFLLRTLSGRAQGELEWSIHRRLMDKRFDRCPPLILTETEEPYFELEGTWYQVQGFLSGAMPDPAEPGVATAMARTARKLARCMPEGFIHGDLGPWNMIQTENDAIFVVDFGSARKGDPYFDFAALLGGVVNHTPENLRQTVCGAFLRELDCDRARLLEQLRLWAEEGVSRWRDQSEKMTARFYNARNWAEENLYDL